MTIQNNGYINLNTVALKKPQNIAEKAIQDAGPDTEITKLAKNTIKSNQTFQFKDSVSSADVEAMTKHVMQQLVADALVSHAAIIRSSHEQKGLRKESAK